MGQPFLTPSVRSAVDQSGLVPFRKPFVVHQKHALLKVPRMGRDRNIGQPQETLRSHLADFERIKVVRFHVRQDPVQCPAYGLLSVETEDPRFDLSQVEQGPSHCAESSIELVAIEILD